MDTKLYWDYIILILVGSNKKRPNFISVRKVWIFNEILLLLGGWAVGWLQCVMRDDFSRYLLIRCKMGICQVTDRFIRCCEDANNFKNICIHFGGKNHHLISFDSICTSKWPFWLTNSDFDPRMVNNIFQILWRHPTPFNPDYCFLQRSSLIVHFPINL